MKLKAYKIEKMAGKPTFSNADALLMDILDELGLIYGNQERDEALIWIDKEDLEEIEEQLENMEEDDDDDNFDEDKEDDDYDDDNEDGGFEYEEVTTTYSDKEFQNTKNTINKIRAELDKDGHVLYILY